MPSNICTRHGCNNVAGLRSLYCPEHSIMSYENSDQHSNHNEDEVIVPSEDDVDEELLTSAFKLSAADLLRKAKKQGIITPTSEYVGVPAA